jgi:hypothetical protein
MEKLIEKLEERIKDYQQNHRGEAPLYILISADDEDRVYQALKEKAGLKSHEFVTSYKGSKIVGHLSLKKGDMTATSELPDAGS